MNENEKTYLEDTIGILINYDGEHTVKGLKALIDETRQRLIKISKNEVTQDDLGFKC